MLPVRKSRPKPGQEHPEPVITPLVQWALDYLRSGATLIPAARKTHALKTWRKMFKAVWDEEKKAEFRVNDRDFQVGDDLLLLEFDEDTGDFLPSARKILARVTHIVEGHSFGIPEGYVMMSIRLISKSHGDRTWKP